MSAEPAASSTLPPYRYTAALANEIEERWRRRWDERGTYLAPNPTGDLAEPNAELAERKAFYALDMFPYPSGSGLHVGHPLGYIGTDVYARFKRMQGFNVLHAMGYDAFGLPAERYAVDHGQHPEVTTRENIANMRRQLARLGLGHDPRRSVATTDVEFYRWTQWIFLQLFHSWYDPEAGAARPVAELVEALDAGRRELPGTGPWASLGEEERASALDGVRLAYLAEVTVNWCPALGTVLANEEVTADGRSEQGNFPVYRRPLRQWMMRITAYADRLISDLDQLDWPDSLKAMQRNWIGRSEGARVEFEVAGGGERMPVFTTRPDTLYGVTFVAVAPEHPLLDGELPAEHAGEVAAYRERASRLSDRQREIGAGEEPSGVHTGLEAIHPLTGDRVPILVADYVLMQYGSGAVMGVPAHDTRDFAFARALGFPIVRVIRPPAAWFSERGLAPDAPIDDWPEAYGGHGESIGAGGPTDGRPSTEVARDIVGELEARGTGSPQIAYKLRDWLFSRQRYWGEPFPIVYDAHDRPHPLPKSLLPVDLPEITDYAPRVSDDEHAEPETPLSRAQDWVWVELDLGDGPRRYRRDTNTMPQWAGSCWYHLRYLDPHDEQTFADPEIQRYWLGDGSKHLGGVDLYVGGVEHAVLHLLYARFWHKVLYDLGHASTPEPFQRLFNQGYVQAAAYADERGFYVEASEVSERDGGWVHDGQPVQRSYGKMGKSLKNSVTPDAIIESYGADALRLYELFLAPLDQDRPWETHGIVGVSRFLQRVWRAVVDEDTGELRVADAPPPRDLERALHRTADSVGRDVERLHFNTAISSLMELVNELRATVPEGEPAPRIVAEWLVAMLAPFAPHLCEELWERLGHEESIVHAPCPEPDPALVAAEHVSVAIQVNGKLRGVAEVAAGTAKDELEALARAQPRIAELLDGAEVRRVVVVPDRLVNFVVG